MGTLASSTLVAACIGWLALAGDGPVREPSSAPPPFVLPADHASTASVGHPFSGSLRDGVRLPVSSQWHEAQPSTRLRDWMYGTGYLVRGVLRVAEAVGRALPGGQTLAVGNLSRHGGGDIKLSVSHNTGRDVDFPYYTATLDGESVVSRYHRFGPDGRSRSAPGLFKLDLPRNWELVKAIMLSNEFEVQWIIVDPHIERLLLDYARMANEPEELRQRAARMLTLPGYAKAHDNHIHVRVLCSPADWRATCLNAGPVWPWSARMQEAFDVVRREVAPRLASSDPAARIEALRQLAHQHVDGAVTDVAPLLSDADAAVRKEALGTLLALATEATAPTLLKISRWCDPTAAAALVERALELAGPDGLPTAQEVMAGAHPVMEASIPRDRLESVVGAARRLIHQLGGAPARLAPGP